MILAIESSCDDSALALLEIASKRLVFHDRIIQNADHAPYGGVVPELAARLHAVNLPKLLEQIAPRLPQVKAIAVTHEPGLTVALAEGVVMAQALALALGVPLIAVNHLKGHLCSLFVEGEALFPLSALMVSGGHSLIIEAEDFTRMRQVASSIDDSMGEAFDKVAKMLGLAYPGGPVIEQLAKTGDENRFDFPLPLRNDPRLAFSYSGLKNSVRLAIEAQGELSGQVKADIAASFQKAAVDHLLFKTRRYLMRARPKRLGLVGGVSANAYLRARFEALCAEFGCEPLFAPLSFCSDNAAMIARAGLEQYLLGDFCDPASVVIRSRAPLTKED
ncbi:MAG: tRNA (adenosine(37)-N6)-threonylcarbamoyltransferase complex transferase subunit TsaD [Campylobacterales bacterium]